MSTIKFERKQGYFMKKKLISLLLSLLFIFCVIPISSTGIEISYAMNNLSDDAKLIKSGLVGNDIKFCATDFKQALGIRNFSAVTIETLPNAEEGTLKYANVRVNEGQKISRSNLYLLKFIPANDTVRKSSFTFSCDNYIGGASVVCELNLLEKLNYEPVSSGASSSIDVSTQKNVSLYGRIFATDPEGDELTFFIVTPTKKGTITFTDTSYGDFKYTPKANFTGKDSFSYVVRDCYGNYSKINTVNISVNKRQTEIVYTDMTENSAYNAALTLASKNIMLGEISGDGMYFYPEKTVSRGEFTVMAMKALGVSANPLLKETSFDDNEKIPTSIRSYIATAQKMRYVNGKFDTNGLYFEAEAAITRAEAAVIISNMLGVSETASVPVFADSEEIPTWAENAIYTLYNIGIIDRTEKGAISAKECITRAQAAEMIYALLSVK